MNIGYGENIICDNDVNMIDKLEKKCIFTSTNLGFLKIASHNNSVCKHVIFLQSHFTCKLSGLSLKLYGSKT